MQGDSSPEPPTPQGIYLIARTLQVRILLLERGTFDRPVFMIKRRMVLKILEACV